MLTKIHLHFELKLSHLKSEKEKRSQRAALKKDKIESKLEQLSIQSAPSQISKSEEKKKENEEPAQVQPSPKVKPTQNKKSKNKKKRQRGNKKKKIDANSQDRIAENSEKFHEINDSTVGIKSEAKIEVPQTNDILMLSDDHSQEQPFISKPISNISIDPHFQDEAYIYPTEAILIPPAITAVMSLVTRLEARAYIVGGYPRDILTNSAHISNDIDLIVELSHNEIITCFAAYHPQPGPFEGLFIIEIDGVKTDIISVPKGFSLRENAEKRDFPFNAIFLDQNGRCYAPLEKTRHFLINIANPQFELISDNPYELFKQNPICMLRVIDFATRMNQFIPFVLQNTIKQCGVYLRDLPFKAFKAHFIKLFYKQNALANFFNMMRTRLFHHIFRGLDINYKIDCKQDSLIREYIVAQLKNWDNATDLKPLSGLFSIFFFPSFVRKLDNQLPDGRRDSIVTNTILNDYTQFLGVLTQDFVNYPLEGIVKQALVQHLQYYDQFVEYSIQRQNALSNRRARVNNRAQLGDYIEGAPKNWSLD
ncbi:MAG: hypothetical protein U1E78_05875 [Gammaproteobacteria bacterium]